MTEINPFYSTKCTPEALEHMQNVRELFKNVADELGAIKLKSTFEGATLKIGGREFALAMTNLEQAAMWAIKAISHYNTVEESK